MQKLPDEAAYIYNWFDQKYKFGELGLFECIALASTQVTNLQYPVSACVISPPGLGKSQILLDALDFFSNRSMYHYVKGPITEYGIDDDKKKYNNTSLSYCLFCLDDIEDFVKAYPRRRVSAILSFFKNLIDGETEIRTKHSSIEFKVKNFGILLNVPEYLVYDTEGKLKGQFLGTFFDRVIPFRFNMDWEMWKGYRDERALVNDDKVKLKVKRGEVKYDLDPFWVRTSDEASKLSTVKFSGLPRSINLVTAFLCGNAKLCNRKEINEDDFIVYSALRKYFGWSR